MKPQKAVQIILAVIGVLYIAMIFPLWGDLRNANWLLVMKNETEPMFLSFFIALGVFLVLAARKPPAYRSLILFAAWQSVAHASVMAIETVEAWHHGTRRDFTDVVLFAIIAVVLLVVSRKARQAGVTPDLIQLPSGIPIGLSERPN